MNTQNQSVFSTTIVGQVFEKYAFSWVIDDTLTTLEKKRSILSPVFSTIADLGKIKWQMKLHIKEPKSENNAVLSVSSFINEPDSYQSYYASAVFIITKKTRDLTYPIESPRLILNKSLIGEWSLSKRELTDPKLTIECVIRIQRDESNLMEVGLVGDTDVKEWLHQSEIIFRDLLDDPKLADLTIKFKDNHNQLRARKCILAAMSPYFADKLGMNTDNCANVSEIELDIDYEVAKEILGYIYTGTAKLHDKDILFNCDLFYSSVVYHLKGLQHLCEENIKQSINSTNVIDVLKKIGDNAIAKNIKEFAVNYIVQNADKMIRS